MSKSTKCPKGFVIAVITLIIIMAILFVAIIVLLMLLLRDGDGVVPSKSFIIDAFDECEKCDECFKCHTSATGQDTNYLCKQHVNSIQCVSQLAYIYREDRSQLPCYQECHRCQDCVKEKIDSRGLEIIHYNVTAFETSFAGYFATPEEVGIIDYEYVCPTNDSGCCEFIVIEYNQTSVPATVQPGQQNGRRKRQVQSCIVEEEKLEAKPYMTIFNKTWHPIWFGPSNVSDEPKLQYYVPIQCDGCPTGDLEKHFIFTTHIPDEEFGFLYHMFLPWENKVKFIPIALPTYCKC